MATSASAPTLSVGLNLFGTPPGAGWRSLLDQARAVEEAGVDRIVVPDHVVNGPEVASYPWGTFPTGPDGDWLEPLTVLTAMAAVTQRVRLSTGVLIAPIRPAALLAKTAATVDVLSGGRLDLGVGTGWQRAEFDAVGLDFDLRGQLLTDTMGACRALWAGGPTTFTSPTIELHDLWCAPIPTQPRLPIWFSGSLHDRNVARIVELGDGWIPIMGSTPADIRAGVDRLRHGLRAAGRDPEQLGVRAALAPAKVDGRLDQTATAALVAELVDAGATDVHVNIRSLAADPSDLARVAAGSAVMVAMIGGNLARPDP